MLIASFFFLDVVPVHHIVWCFIIICLSKGKKKACMANSPPNQSNIGTSIWSYCKGYFGRTSFLTMWWSFIVDLFFQYQKEKRKPVWLTAHPINQILEHQYEVIVKVTLEGLESWQCDDHLLWIYSFNVFPYWFMIVFLNIFQYLTAVMFYDLMLLT